MKITSNAEHSIFKSFLVASVLLFAFLFLSSCQKRLATTTNQASSSPSASPAPTPSPHATADEARSYYGTGAVTKIVRENPLDKSLASVEMDHGEIVGLMPAMRMEFYVKDVSMLDGLKKGDVIDFTIEVKGSTEIISEIKKK